MACRRICFVTVYCNNELVWTHGIQPGAIASGISLVNITLTRELYISHQALALYYTANSMADLGGPQAQ